MSDEFVPDETKEGKLVSKPVEYLRKKPFVKDLMEQSIGYLTDQSGRHLIKLEWHLNEVAQRDHVFKLTIDEKEVYLDLEELTFYTRVMFEKKGK